MAKSMLAGHHQLLFFGHPIYQPDLPFRLLQNLTTNFRWLATLISPQRNPINNTRENQLFIE
jgi:hypothetical protein